MNNNTTQAPLQGAEWEECTIAIACIEGRATRSGKKLGNTGLGYYVTSPSTPEYAPIHIQSGWHIGPMSFGNEECCQKYIEELATLMNWNQPRETLLADPAYNTARIIEIFKKHQCEDAAATAGGGAW